MARKKKSLNPPTMDRAAVDRAIEALTKLRNPTRPVDEVVQLKVRLPELLRFQLESEARRSNRSMNAEIVSRLNESFLVGEVDRAKTVAIALVATLDNDTLDEIESLLNPQRYDVNDDTLKREAETILSGLDRRVLNAIVEKVLGAVKRHERSLGRPLADKDIAGFAQDVRSENQDKLEIRQHGSRIFPPPPKEPK
jgi:hypothetical protein